MYYIFYEDRLKIVYCLYHKRSYEFCILKKKKKIFKKKLINKCAAIANNFNKNFIRNYL